MTTALIFSLFGVHTSVYTSAEDDKEIRGPVSDENGMVTWDVINYGQYNQSISEIKRTPLKWRILKVDGDKALVLSDRIIDSKSITNSGFMETKWSDSSLRYWLRDEFYNDAFTAKEREAIESETVQTPDNPKYGNGESVSSVESIFLLSVDEVTNEDYGFSADSNTYDTGRTAEATMYSYSEGLLHSNPNSIIYSDDYSPWFLRTQGSSKYNMSYVGINGEIAVNGTHVNINGIGVRPAMWVDLRSESIQPAGEVDANGYVSENKDGYNDPVSKDGDACLDCIYLGNYYD